MLAFDQACRGFHRVCKGFARGSTDSRFKGW